MRTYSRIAILASFLVLSNTFVFLLIGSCGSDDADDAADDTTDDDTGDDDTSTDSATDGDDDTGDDDDSDVPYDDYKPCPYDKRHGTFKVTLQAALGDVDPFTGVDGYVADIIKPTTIPNVLQTADACRLLQAPIYECDPPCTATQTCGPDNACFDPPTNLDVGTVTVTGCKAPVTMEPNVANYYTNLDPLPEIGFDEGADLRLEASGGELEPFALRGRGVTYLEIPEGAVAAEKDKPIAVTWTPLTSGIPSRLLVEVSLNNHGSGIKTWIECDAEDTGSLEISAVLVNGLFDAGVSGWPTIMFWRRTADSTEISLGCVEFLVLTRDGREIAIPDVTSCREDTDCPDGQVCMTNMLCGEE